MQTLYPLTFDLAGLTQDYLWGGSKLKPLLPQYPTKEPLAEIWVVSDRPEDDRVGIISNGPLAGTNLRELMEHRANDVVGRAPTVNGKFPLLIKLMNSELRLSLQVHPATEKAQKLQGDPKTECWTFLDGTASSAQLFAGVNPGVNRERFESVLMAGGNLEPLLHTMHQKPGDCLYLPSGRLHAMDAGSVFYEVQQNSNTTYRVFDWNRVDNKTGQPRELHIDKALESIDFTDVEPKFQQPIIHKQTSATIETLVDCEFFTLERWTTSHSLAFSPAKQKSFDVITVIDGSASLDELTLDTLGTSLIPAAVHDYTIEPKTDSLCFLRTFVRT